MSCHGPSLGGGGVGAGAGGGGELVETLNVAVQVSARAGIVIWTEDAVPVGHPRGPDQATNTEPDCGVARSVT
ncbi:MAG TPA: hypothetical protein VFQ15_05965, partial [Jiangellaceae bacterium]|nr:hypothetical protein [Jiangellaceae bacterium]